MCYVAQLEQCSATAFAGIRRAPLISKHAARFCITVALNVRFSFFVFKAWQMDECLLKE